MIKQNDETEVKLLFLDNDTQKKEYEKILNTCEVIKKEFHKIRQSRKESHGDGSFTDETKDRLQVYVEYKKI